MQMVSARVAKSNSHSRSLNKETIRTSCGMEIKEGKFRPALLGYARNQEESAVVDVTSRAWESIKPYAKAEEGNSESASHRSVPETAIDEALGILTSLKGVGPATASAILASMHKSIPFMSDEALMVTLGKREYTLKAYKKLVKALRATRRKLCSEREEKGLENGMLADRSHWTVGDVEMCIFASYNAGERKGNLQQEKKTRKRKGAG